LRSKYGEGEAFFEQKRVKGKVALEKAGLKPITLQAKEGLSLINGTQFMTGMAARRCVPRSRRRSTTPSS
jgi:histidine ammonia-lyase